MTAASGHPGPEIGQILKMAASGQPRLTDAAFEKVWVRGKRRRGIRGYEEGLVLETSGIGRSGEQGESRTTVRKPDNGN